MKVRGITLNVRNSARVNSTTLERMVKGLASFEEEERVTLMDPHKIVRSVKTKDIESRVFKKGYRVVFDKRWISDGFDTILRIRVSINKGAICIFMSFDIEMEPEKLPQEDDKSRKQYTSLPLLTGACTSDASLPTDPGLGSVNPLENCVCKDNLKKYATLPMIGIALLLLTNTAITITQHQAGTLVNFCRNFTLLIDVFTPPTTRSVEDKKSNETIQVPRTVQKLSGAKLVSSGR